MSTPGNLAVPFQGPTSSATDFQALQFFLEQRLRKVQTSILVEVLAVQPAGTGELSGTVGTVDVQILVDQVDGAGNVVPHVKLFGRPYSRIQGGQNAYICDPQVNDIGLMVFGSRDLSNVIESLVNSPPGSNRLFSYADGLYVGGYLNGAPVNYVRIADNGAIDIVSTQSVSITAPTVSITTTGNVDINGAIISSAGEVTDAAGKVLGTHIHSGVQPGGGDSGPPV